MGENRIEARLNALKKEGKKAFITYMTAGLPSIDGTKEIIKAQEEAGTSVVELGIPFSDPVADGPVIQEASFESIKLGTNVSKVFQLVREVREEGCKVPVAFMLYYNTVLYYGVEKFVESCISSGVDGLIIPDIPLEEQGEIKQFLTKEGAPLLIQLVAPVSKDRIPMIAKEAKGFIYCVSSMGVTGQDADFHKDVRTYLQDVRKASPVPVMMGFGIRTPKDVEDLKDVIDGCIVGSEFIRLMKENSYQIDQIKNYCSSFVKELND